MARQFATLVGSIAAANGVTLDESDLLAAWGFYQPPPPPQTQQQADDAMRAAWG